MNDVRGEGWSHQPLLRRDHPRFRAARKIRPCTTSWRVLVVRCGRWMMPKRWSYHFDYRITKIWGQWMFLTGEPKTIVLYRILHTHHILWMLSPVLFLKISLLFPIYVFLDPKQTLTVCWTWSPPDGVQPLQLPVQDGYRVIQILNPSESLDQRKI